MELDGFESHPGLVDVTFGHLYPSSAGPDFKYLRTWEQVLCTHFFRYFETPGLIWLVCLRLGIVVLWTLQIHYKLLYSLGGWGFELMAMTMHIEMGKWDARNSTRSARRLDIRSAHRTGINTPTDLSAWKVQVSLVPSDLI